MILVGDIGGTNCRFGTWAGGALRDVRVWPTAEVRTLTAGVGRYLELHPFTPAASCVAVAGPVTDGQAELTNARWSGRASDLPGEVGLLINDLHAAARGLSLVGAADQIHLGGPPAAPDGPGVAAVMGVGTGLGQTLLVGEAVVATEGGHAGFAPEDDAQRRLLAWLAAELPRVSVEHVVSGAGLGRVLRFTLAEGGALSAEAAAALSGGAAAEVVAMRFAGSDPVCAAALGMYLQLVGSAAGNLALSSRPRRGVFLCGGVLPRVAEAVGDGRLRAAFEAKPPMRGLLRDVPLVLVTEGDLGLLGAAAEARRALR